VGKPFLCGEQVVTVKLEAAYHEAGHAVAAHYSRFHTIVGPINLQSYGAGEVFVGFNAPKCVAAGLPADARTALRPEVTRDLGVILVAGLAAERIAAKRNPALAPNERCANPDYDLLRQQLEAAGLSKKTDIVEGQAVAILTARWPLVEGLAEALFNAGELMPIEIRELLASIEARLAEEAVTASANPSAPFIKPSGRRQPRVPAVFQPFFQLRLLQ